MNRRSIRVRYVSTFATNIIRVCISFVASLVIARNLGPSNYGDFNFLLGSFTALASLVNMASSSAFFTFISQKKRGRNFYVYYACWLCIQLCILILLVLFLSGSLRQKIWLGHSMDLVMLALAASFTMNQLWGFFSQVGESIRDTVGVQVRNLLLMAVYLLLILILAQNNLISTFNLFLVNAFLYFIFAVLYGLRLYYTKEVYTDELEHISLVFAKYKNYCQPLILFILIGFFYTFSDYWFLQKYSGSIQQGYYAIGARFSALSLIATTSILKIFWKEIAEANYAGKMEKVRIIYHQVSRTLFFVGAVISCLLISFSQEILELLLGPSYQDAWIPLSIMFLYPLHQSIGQINGTMFYAIGKTRTKSSIGILSMAISIPITYIVLAPSSASDFLPGLNLGAMGLSLKMVCCQLLTTNLMAFFIARYINSSFDWLYQLNVLLLLPLGLFCKFIADGMLSFISFQSSTLLVMVISGILYLISIVSLIYYFPSIAGIKKSQINQGCSWLRDRIWQF